MTILSRTYNNNNDDENNNTNSLPEPVRNEHNNCAEHCGSLSTYDGRLGSGVALFGNTINTLPSSWGDNKG